MRCQTSKSSVSLSTSTSAMSTHCCSRGEAGAIGTDEAAEPAHEDTEGPDTTEEVEEQAAPATSWSAPLAAVTLLRYLNDEISERLGVDFELGHVYFLGVSDWAGLAQTWDRRSGLSSATGSGRAPTSSLTFCARIRQMLRSATRSNGDVRAGKALSVASITGLSNELIGDAFLFLCTGRL